MGLKARLAWLMVTVLFVIAGKTILADDHEQLHFMPVWNGPLTGPVAQPGKKVMFISADFKNGGISAVYRGFYTAAIVLKWDILLVDGKGDESNIRTAFAKAIQSHQNAIILGGFGTEEYTDAVAQARRAGLILVGWHAADKPGATKELFVNITTEAAEVAKLAADYAISNGNAHPGFVIFNDNRYAIANAKTRSMQEAIQRCSQCKLLSIENLPISEASSRVSDAVKRLNQVFGKQWTHTLAINDVYFDSMNYPLTWIKRPDIVNVSAGDGSRIAIDRVISGRSQQIATVAEPTGLQGWQLADELNRAFSGTPPSTYVSKPILVTARQSKQSIAEGIDSGIPYEAVYTAIWAGKKIDDTFLTRPGAGH